MEMRFASHRKVDDALEDSEVHEEAGAWTRNLPERTGRKESAAVDKVERSRMNRGADVVSLDLKSPGMRKVDDRRIVREVVVGRPISPERDQDLVSAVERYKLLGTRVLQVARTLR
jgi:hypothetical protein